MPLSMPKEIKNLKKAARRILKAIKSKERIVIYADADLDGVSSAIILEESIKNLAGGVSVIYFPDREKNGYGINEKALFYLKKHSPALFLALDCGIGNFKEVKLAKKLGFEIIIIDHHEILDGLPEAKIIVDPKQKGDKYPFKGFATAGIIFKLSEALLAEKMTENLRKNFLELTALATIADMMPKESENLEFINQGLKLLENSWRPGIQALMRVEEFNQHSSLNQKIPKIISLLNVRDVAPNQEFGAGMPAPFRLLTSTSLEEAKKTVELLLEKNKVRKEKVRIIVTIVEEKIAKNSTPVIFEGGSFFEVELISTSASLICQKYQKPTFLYKKMEKESQGTVRTPTGIDSVALMKKCKKYLITYGGHPQASGFRVKNENLEKFKNCLIKNLGK